VSQAVIFDLDGTLLDTIEDIGASTNRVLRARGLPTHDTAAYRRMVGAGITELLRRAIPPSYHDRLDDFVADFRRDYGGHLVEKTHLFPGIRELLDALADVPKAILSNKPHDFTRQIGAQLFAPSDFVEVFGHRDGKERKPAPDSAIELAGILGLPPERIFFVGDSSIDMETATRAGMHPIAVSWGYQNGAHLRSAGAEALLEQPLELVGLLRTSR